VSTPPAIVPHGRGHGADQRGWRAPDLGRVLILNGGVGKRAADEQAAAGMHDYSATGTYPFLGTMQPTQFARAVSTSEIVIGAALLTPSCRRRSPAPP